jgi:transposase-like protein
MIKYTKLSNYTIKKILRCFCTDLTAVQTSKLLDINRNTINRFYKIFREIIIELSTIERAGKIDNGEVELDESYFGAKRVRGKKGRGARGKTIVFGILKRDGKVFTNIVANCSRSELLPIIQGKVLENTTVYTDGWRSYDGLITLGYKHYRIHHHNNEFARGKNHVNGIESFWSYAKTRLSKFRGFKGNLALHLRECEFRFNHRDDLEPTLLKKLKVS